MTDGIVIDAVVVIGRDMGSEFLLFGSDVFPDQIEYVLFGIGVVPTAYLFFVHLLHFLKFGIEGVKGGSHGTEGSEQIIVCVSVEVKFTKHTFGVSSDV